MCELLFVGSNIMEKAGRACALPAFHLAQQAMVEIAGSWELGWSAPLTEMQRWWAVMRSFGLTRLNITPVSGIRHKLVQEYHSFEELLADRATAGLEPVYIDEGGPSELEGYQHPDNVLYIFGKANWSPRAAYGPDCASVSIASPVPGMLWPDQALAVIMYDRLKKEAHR